MPKLNAVFTFMRFMDIAGHLRCNKMSWSGAGTYLLSQL